MSINPTMNRGIVRAMSLDRTRMTIAMPRGGSFECDNNGFDVGQAVCFLLDGLGKRVIKVWPREIAEAMVVVGSLPEVQEVIAANEAWQEKSTAEEDSDIEKILEAAAAKEADNASYSEGYFSQEEIDKLSFEDGEPDAGGETTADWPIHLTDASDWNLR
jgi:hypothetical protein